MTRARRHRSAVAAEPLGRRRIHWRSARLTLQRIPEDDADRHGDCNERDLEQDGGQDFGAGTIFAAPLLYNATGPM